MQLSNMLGQYANTSQASTVTSQMGTQKLVSSALELMEGNIFEGTVNTIKDGQVVLRLSNGQTLSARLDASVLLEQGQSLFFQVKSNDGATIAIRPFTLEGSQVNVTQMSALSAANLPVDEKNLTMINSMMEKAMPIDRDSLAKMSRLMANYPNTNVGTLVEMQNLKLPTTPEMISQFENYANDKQAITTELRNYMEQLPTALASQNLTGDELSQMAGKVLTILTEGLETTNIDAFPENVNGEISQEVATAVVEDVTVEASEEGKSEVSQRVVADSSAPGSLGSVFKTNQMAVLTENLYEAHLLPENQTLQSNQNAMALLQDIARELLGQSHADKDSLMKLFTSEEFQQLTKEAMEQQWTFKPQDLAGGESDKISKMYEHLKSQLDRIESAVKETGGNSLSLSQTADEIRSNVDFMNQINQTYQYVQIPLQMNGKYASGELYVYTNKKAINEDGELSAFLHLDMDHLGSTDVSIKMIHKEVDTKFYFDNDESYQLVMKHSDELAERLNRKGFHCKISVVNENHHQNFVQDFLKKDSVSVGKMHRFSFDMRA